MKKAAYFILSCSLLIYSCRQKKEMQPIAPVVTHLATMKIANGNVSTTLRLPAQFAAYQEVSIFPKVNGYVKTVLVDIGLNVLKGQPLMTLEAPELLQASVQARERFNRSQSDYQLSKESYDRLKQASQTAGAISPLDLSSAKSKMDALYATGNAEKANWQMQQEMLSYLRVNAPFAGTITERTVSPGALVSASGKDGKPMLELKEIDHLRLQVDIPEAIAAHLQKGDSISFTVSAFPGKIMSGVVSRKSGSINMQLRSEKIEVDVPNKQSLLAPGMFADVVIDNKGNATAFAIPKTAVVTSTERKYVIAIRNGKTVKVDVTTGNETVSKIEVFGNLLVADEIIVDANDEIKEGIPL